MTRSTSWCSLLPLTLVVAACGGGSGSKTAAEERAAAKTPDELNALFKREKDLPKSVSVSAPDGSWRALFPSETEPTVEVGEGFVHVTFSLGTEEPTQCFLYTDTIDAGQTMTKMLAGLRQNVEFSHVAPYRIATAGGLPLVFVEGRYVADSPEGKVAGSIKLGVTPRFVTPILCFLDEPGYPEVFAEAMTQISKSIEVKEPKSPPMFTEVWAMQLEDVPVGYQMLQVLDGGDGSLTSIALSGTFIPTGPGELSTSDEVEVIQTDPSGVLKGKFLEVEGTEVSHELTMSRKGKSGYVVSGTYQGKELKNEFKADILSDSVAFYRYLQKNRGKSGKVTVLEYSPSLDPTAPSKITYELDAAQNTVSHRAGELVSTSTLGESGLPEGMSLPIGVRKLTGTVIDRQGKL